MVDVLIQTHNEAMNLPHALASLRGWVNRVFVVDSGSTDETVSIAQSFGATVVVKAWEGYARQKNWALDHLPFESDWVLILDADESITPELQKEIASLVSRPTANVSHAGYYINRLTIFMGREIWHCGYFPAWNMRLFKRGAARYEERDVHEHMIVQGATGRLRHWMRHEDRRGLEHFIAKHNRYSTLEAREIYRQREQWPGVKRFLLDRMARRRYVKYRLAPKLALPWMLRFFYMYFVRGGILDREAGLTLCLMISTYELFIRAKYNELVRLGGRAPTQVEGLAIEEGGVAGAAFASIMMVPQPTPPAPNNESIEAASTPTPPLPPSGGNGAAGPAAKRGKRRGPVRREESPWGPMEKIKRVLWMLVRALLFRPSFHNWYGWRRILLRVFGAKVGRDVRIRPSARIEIPWNLEVGDQVVIGDHAIIYSLGRITIGPRAMVSQYAHLCAGTHDYTTRVMPLVRLPIHVGEDAWVAADAFVGPGVSIGDRAVVGARSSVFKDVPADQVVGGPGVGGIAARELRD